MGEYACGKVLTVYDMRSILSCIQEQSTDMGHEQQVAEEESGDEQSAHVPVEARHLVLYRPFPLFAA